MKNLFKIYFCTALIFASIQCIYARKLVIANIAKPLKPDDAYPMIGITATFDGNGRSTQANAVPILTYTPGITGPSAAQLAQAPRYVGYILNIRYFELNMSKTLNSVVSSCLTFMNPKKSKANYKASPVTFEKFTNNEVVFTFSNKLHNILFSCHTFGSIESKEYQFKLERGEEPVYLLVDNKEVRRVTRQQMHNEIANRKCY